ERDLEGGLRQGARRGPRGPRRLPAGRVPERGRLHPRDAAHGRGRLRRHRGRAALQRPRDGRSDHPGRRPARPRRRRPDPGRPAGRRGGRRGGGPHPGDDLLEPGRALRRGALGRGPRRRRRSGDDHPRPHARPRRRVGRGGRRPRPRQGLPRRAQLDPGPGRDDDGRLPGLRLRHRRHGGHGCPDDDVRPRRAPRRAGAGHHRPADRRRPRRQHRRPGRRGGGLRRRRDRRLGDRPDAPRPPRRRGGRARRAAGPGRGPRRRGTAWPSV
ncbi:MAG: Tryptophan synthase alpha chain, partial [uncultured Nocardioides sp.]